MSIWVGFSDVYSTTVTVNIRSFSCVKFVVPWKREFLSENIPLYITRKNIFCCLAFLVCLKVGFTDNFFTQVLNI